MSLVSITQEEYFELVESKQKLDALEAAGVDNWEGYGDAMELLGEDDDEESEEDIYGPADA